MHMQLNFKHRNPHGLIAMSWPDAHGASTSTSRIFASAEPDPGVRTRNPQGLRSCEKNSGSSFNSVIINWSIIHQQDIVIYWTDSIKNTLSDRLSASFSNFYLVTLESYASALPQCQKFFTIMYIRFIYIHNILNYIMYNNEFIGVFK